MVIIISFFAKTYGFHLLVPPPITQLLIGKIDTLPPIKWSSDRTGAKMVEGLKFYQDTVKWCRALKNLWYDKDSSEEQQAEYEGLRVACNMKAKEMGFILSKSAMTLKKDQDYEEEEVELATFDFGEMNEVRGDCY
jgi:hypothetical protein